MIIVLRSVFPRLVFAHSMRSIAPRLSGLLLCLAMTACQSQIRIEPIGVAASPVRSAEAVPLSKDRITSERVLHLRDQLTQNKVAQDQLEEIVANYARIGHRQIMAPDDRALRLQRIFDDVHRHSHLADMPLKPLLIEKDIFQAYTLGGLEVIFYSGLTESLSDDGLAIIIGHEIAHIAAGHAVEQVSRDVVNLSHLHHDEARLSGFYAIEAEYEADMVGLLYATLAGYDASKASEIWQVLMDVRDTPKFNLFTATHPPDELRDERLTDQAKMIEHLHDSPQWQKDLKCNPLYCSTD